MNSGKKEKIKLLIIDDEKEICKHEKVIFERRNFEVYTAETGKTALELLKTVKPDMALIDIHMTKGMSGLEILEGLLRIHSKCRCIMVTWDKERALAAKEMGAVDYLIKPVELRELDNTINKIAKSLNKNRHPIMRRSEDV